MTYSNHTKLAVFSVLCCLVVAALAVTASAATAGSRSTSTACGAVASGAHWKYKGQQGTAYQVIAVNGSRTLCATAVKWMPRLSANRATFQLKVAPPGWRCSAVGDYSALAKMGQCQVTGAIIEWLPKLKR